MNVLDIDKATLEGACYRASQSHMWDARQQTDPERMLLHALSAHYAEQYPDCLVNMYRDKFLTSFELSLSGGTNDMRPSPELDAALADFIGKTVQRHASDDLASGSLVINLSVAKAVMCAEQAAKTDDYVVGSRVSALRREQKAKHGTVSLKGEATVRDWYRQTYPDDELGADIDPALTFGQALDAVPTGGGFYDALGVGDSLVRERVFGELSQRSGFTYEEIYDSYINGEPLPGRGLLDAVYGHGIYAEMRDKVAVGVGYVFNVVKAAEVTRAGIELRESGTVVAVDGREYPLMKGATYKDSCKVDALLDSHGEMRVSNYRKPQAVSLKDEAAQARQASERLAGGTEHTPSARRSARADGELE